MSDIKLFQFAEQGVTELPGAAVQVEKSLQVLFEANLEALLGIRFIATEHSTGPVHGGRIWMRTIRLLSSNTSAR